MIACFDISAPFGAQHHEPRSGQVPYASVSDNRYVFTPFGVAMSSTSMFVLLLSMPRVSTNSFTIGFLHFRKR
ncbi:hypothetical protein SISNIDRAFT_449002 [Sistotremastrum niveocremeum HHB9708]|uniref:Uncharacterized protein n=1 Tax=Sistotremastrum niveocremeum HHB9708 TaxID=1314777 RepID=A0A165AAM4_9AGAM|nr:hypothetical protein SISNIDRAFT_449002 [Sistotremastrum niveocremeum HHB9708]